MEELSPADGVILNFKSHIKNKLGLYDVLIIKKTIQV